MRSNDTNSVVSVAVGTCRERVCARIAKPLFTCVLRQRNCAIARSSVGDRRYGADYRLAMPCGRAMPQLHPAAVGGRCPNGRFTGHILRPGAWQRSAN